MTICDDSRKFSKAGKLSGPFESQDLFGAYDLKIPRTIASRHVRHYYDPSTTWRLARTVGSAGTTASVWRRLTRPVTKHTTTCSELLRSPLRPLLRPPRHGHDANYLTLVLSCPSRVGVSSMACRRLPHSGRFPQHVLGRNVHRPSRHLLRQLRPLKTSKRQCKGIFNTRSTTIIIFLYIFFNDAIASECSGMFKIA